MVLINGTYDFKVYDLDTQQSAIDRLAAELNTLPKYLYFPNGIPTIQEFQQEDNIKMENLYETITGKGAGVDFTSIFENVKGKIGQQNLRMYEDIFLPFIVFNKTLVEAQSSILRNAYILSIETNVQEANIFEKDPKIFEIWNRERKDILQKMNQNIKANKTKAENQRRVFEQFEKVSDILPYTAFELERVNFEFTLDILHLSIIEFFNHIQLNPGVPFASVNGFFKILKDFVPPEEWGVYLETAIIFKVLQKTELAGSKITDYTDAILSIMGEPGQEIVTIGMSLLTSGQYLSREQLIDRFLGTIKGLGDIKVKSVEESKVNGVFYLPKHNMDKYVLADLIMNNPLFYSMMSIDESEKASKKKESVYIHFYHPKIGAITANITEKLSEKGDPALRGKDVKGNFKFGSNYIRVKISSADSIKAVKKFQEMFAKLMSIYDKEYKSIVNFYRQFIPNFAEVKVKQPRLDQKLKLKDIAPEVFVRGYPPKCPHQPTIIGDDEVDEAKEAGKIVMRYPQDENEGFIPRNYICEHPKAIYPGLRENPLSNRDTIPYLPCCYTKNHANRQGTIFRHYYYGEDLRAKMDGDQQDLIITNKFVPKDKYGTLPVDITKLFDIFDYKEGYMYVRKGVYNNKSTFLDCVMEGMYEETDILRFADKDEREGRLYQIRDELATKARAASCRQEMYDFTIEKILEAIRDNDLYFDPKLFTALLEEYFNCNIYVFNRTGIRTGQLALPRHLQAYYKTKRRAKCVFIYEHWGSTSDHAQYPRCELIVRWRIGGGGEDDVSYYSTYHSKVAEGIRRVYNRMRKSYALNLEIPETIFPIKNPKIKLTEQGIDSYGKCRMLRFKYKGQTGTLLTSPIQPLVLPEVRNWVATKINQDLVLDLAAVLNIPITGQSVLQDVVKELYGKLGNVRVSIPVEDGIPMEGVPILDLGVSYPENEISVVDNYNKYKKLARYITEYMYWLFSKYLHDRNIKEIDLEVMKKFVKNKIKIAPDFEYGHVGKTFTMRSGVMEGGKLVIKSDEALKRLVYTLRVFIRRYRQKLLNYHTRQVIENYYVDITDFDHHHFQVILQGDKSVEKWIQEQKIKYNLYSNVQIKQRMPYFFQNQLVGTRIWLAQNTDSVYKAIKIVQTWLQSGYNPGENPQDVPSKLTKMTLYRYINDKDIKAFRIAGTPTPLEINILGYKIEDQSFFTALMPL